MSMTELASRTSTIGISHHRRTAQKKPRSSLATSRRARTLAINYDVRGAPSRSYGRSTSRRSATAFVSGVYVIRRCRPPEFDLGRPVLRARVESVTLKPCTSVDHCNRIDRRAGAEIQAPEGMLRK